MTSQTSAPGRLLVEMTPTETGMALFETALGRCGVAWGERGLLAVALPHVRDERTLAGLRLRAPGAIEATPPPGVDDAVDGMVALLEGEPSDLTEVELDLGRVPSFDRRVAATAREIPPGATLTYGELATRIGAPGEAREVGAALGRNRFPLVVPCHRIVAADGRLGGFSAPGGTETKRRLLAIERHHAAGPLSLFEA
jgi:methylated-DNA-[protein]-cysteine S-methyltransferase